MHQGRVPLIVHIVQPALPKYRLAFFRQLEQELSKRNGSLRLYASPRDHLGVVSSAPTGFEAMLEATMSIHLGRRAFWQRDLDVPLARGDILVINGNPRMLSNYPLWLRAKLLRVPVIWWGHGWSAGSYGARSRLRQRIMRFADATVLYTDKERDDYIALGFAPDRTYALNNGLDIHAIDDAIAKWDGARTEEFRRTNELNACANWCIFIGSLSSKSEIGLLIDSLPAIRKDVGLIALGDGVLAQTAKERARSLGVDSRIIWAGAEFDENAIAPWMLSARALVYPGTVGLSLIHGFSYGLPAVVHGDAREQMPEFAAFENERNGLSFENGSASSLALTVNKLFEDRARQAQMSQQATELVHRTFNVQDMSRRFMEVIDRLSPSQRQGSK
jgi:glycosyltransferase involved in cell wall biosynthesis